MQQPYRWRCFACEASNEASAESCTACGFPARATGHQIEAARATRNPQSLLLAAAPGLPSALTADVFDGLTGWRKVVSAVAMVFLGLGGIGLKAMSSWRDAGLSALALILGFVLVALVHHSAPTARATLERHDG